MNRKKTVWFEVSKDETVESCLKRMAAEGYVVTGRKEEPLFIEANGEFVPKRQLIKFSGAIIKR